MSENADGTRGPEHVAVDSGIPLRPGVASYRREQAQEAGIDFERIKRLKEKYRDDGLERLMRSNYDYYSTHGDYVPELAALLLAERAEMRALLATPRGKEA